MKTLALVNTHLVSKKDIDLLSTLEIAESKIQCGLVEVNKPNFHSYHEVNHHYVLVKVDAFSCNYRDKAIILKAALKMKGNTIPFAFFGSDFVGTIVEKGKYVEEFPVGSRVIPNCAYPEPPFLGIAPGVVTNEASKGWLRLHKSKLIRVPDKMHNSIAATFTIGAQTSYSMIRRTNINKGERALVTSARSNTALFLIHSLLAKEINVVALSTSEWSDNEEKFILPAKLFKVERGPSNWTQYGNLSNFDVVFDPFYDLHLFKSVKQLNMGGRYITCGYKNQHQNFVETTDDLNVKKVDQIMLTVMINNLSIMGNCIGTTDDLQKAIEDYNPQKPPIPIKEFSPSQGAQFLNHTYNKKNRFGKMVMCY